MNRLCYALAAIFVVSCSPIQPAHSQTAQTVVAAAQTTSVSPAPADTTLNYADLLVAIRKNNPSIRAATIGAAAMATNERRVTALPDPMVMITYQPWPLLTARGSQRSQVRVEQSFPYPGKRKLKGAAARYTAMAAESEVDALALDLLLRARIAWLDLQQVERIERHVLLFQSHLRDYEDVASQQYAVGTGPQQPILKAQLERTSLSRMLLDLSARATTARETLRGITGMPAVATTDSALAVRRELPPLDVDMLLTIARTRRPEFESLRLLSQNADAGIALARKNYLPDFGVNLTWFDIASESVPPTATGRDALAVGVSVKVPLWRAPRAAGVEQMQLSRQQIDARRESLELELDTRISELVQRLQTDLDQLRLYEQALIPQAEATIEASMSSYSTGGTDFMTLLDSERMLFTLNTGYEDARTRYASTMARLERMLGITELDQLFN